jgi:PBSX family phage terminase large subunit|tara:strand:+ start:230 stop:1645 length:1416 start_codon:yes stop_codon:yes gene_type:complete
MNKENIYIGYTDEDGSPSEPLSHQEEYHLYTGYTKHHLMAGSLGTGKTDAMCVEAIKQSVEIKGNLGLMGRKVLDAFKKSTLLQLLDIAGDTIRRHRPVDHLIEFKNGSRIIYMALDDSRDAIQRIKSLNLGFFAFDQLEEVPENTFIAAAGQLRRKGSMRCSFHTCNPAGHNWVWQRWKKDGNRVPKKYRLIETRTWSPGVEAPVTEAEVRAYSDNPYLPADYITELLSMPAAWVKRYVYCNWDDFAGLVYPMFDEKVHFIKPWNIPAWYNHYVVYDYGYKNPSAIIFAATDDEGKIFIYNLIYEVETPIAELAVMVKDRLRKDVRYTFLADPSIMRTERDGMTIADEWGDYGIYWEPAKNDKRAGYDRVGRYLSPADDGYARLVFFNVPQMEPLREEIIDFKWKELRYGHGDRPLFEEAVKVNDHAMDCLRYLVHYVEDARPVKKQVDWGVDWYRLAMRGKGDNSWMGI